MVLKYDDHEVFGQKLTAFANANWDKIRKSPAIPPDLTKEKYISTLQGLMTAPWYRDILLVDPPAVLETVSCPVLALNGEKDVQVPSKENLMGISNALTRGGNKNFTVKALPNLNHFFQECETGALREYASIEQTFSPAAMREISAWVLEQLKER